MYLQTQTEQGPDEEEEVESKADRRTVGLRCFQGNRETSEDEPSELVKLNNLRYLHNCKLLGSVLLHALSVCNLPSLKPELTL